MSPPQGLPHLDLDALPEAEGEERLTRACETVEAYADEVRLAALDALRDAAAGAGTASPSQARAQAAGLAEAALGRCRLLDEEVGRFLKLSPRARDAKASS